MRSGLYLPVKKMRCVGAMLLLFVMCHLLFEQGAFCAEPEMLPPDMQAKLFLTALTYINNLVKDDDRELAIGVVCFRGMERGKRQAEDLIRALTIYKDKTVAGRTFTTSLMEYQDMEAFREAVRRQRIKVLCVAPGPVEACSQVSRLTRDMKILSFTPDTRLLTDCGLTLSIAASQGRPRVYLNQQAAQAEGMEISSKLLRIAVLVSKNQ